MGQDGQPPLAASDQANERPARPRRAGRRGGLDTDTFVQWPRIVDMARSLRDRHASGDRVEPAAWVYLARTILLFQVRVLGRFIRPER
jgi:hypothetical protein